MLFFKQYKIERPKIQNYHTKTNFGLDIFSKFFRNKFSDLFEVILLTRISKLKHCLTDIYRNISLLRFEFSDIPYPLSVNFTKFAPKYLTFIND